MKKSIALLTIAGVFSAAFTSQAVSIEVLQGGASLGSIEAYSGPESASDNYNYFSSKAHLVNGPGHVDNEEQLFFYIDGSGDLHFNVLFREGSGVNRSIDWDIAVDSSGDQSVLVSDDDGELSETVAGPGITENFVGDWVWNENFTDGGVIGDLQGGDWEIRIDPQGYGGGVGSENIQVYSSDDSSIGLAKNTTDQIVFRVKAVPEAGSTIGLLLLGAAALVGFRPSKRRDR